MIKPSRTVALLTAGLIVLGALSLWPIGSVTSDNLPPKTCFTSTEQGAGRVFYVDAMRGLDDGDGSAARPWRSLQEVLDGGLVGDRTRRRTFFGKIRARLTGNWHDLPSYQNRSAIVHGGDTILLGSGNYGAIHVAGLSNDRPITIAAAPGANARIDRISLTSSRGFTFRNFTIAPANLAKPDFLISTRPSPDVGRSYNIRFTNLTLDGPGDIARTKPTAWSKSGSSGVMLFGECLALEDSSITDVRFGTVIFRSSRTTVASNTIRNFSVDGIDFTGNDLTISNNVIADHWPTGDDLHPDCMQGQSGLGQPPYERVRITGNVCLSNSQERHSGDLQGISIFDGRWNGVEVSCNLVRSTMYHAIALYGVDRALIDRNIVFGWKQGLVPWIAALPSKKGRSPTQNVIRNNRATRYLNAAAGSSKDLEELVREGHSKPEDSAAFRALFAGDIPGVTLQDNAWMHPGPDLTGDKRFRQPGGVAPAGPVSIADAKAELARMCPRG